MILVCQNCSTRLQIDDEKSPSGNFTVRCPKCNSTVNSSSTNQLSEQSALGLGGSPSTERQRFERPTAPAFQLASEVKDGSNSMDETVRALLGLLTKGAEQGLGESGGRQPWTKRKVLVCTAEAHRERIARKLTEEGYQVFVAEDTRQAVETMRANQLQVVLLDPLFDTAEQGSAFVVREINVMRPPQRRRLFFVLISPSLRTMDAHAAFLSNANAVVNISDVDDLSRILDVALREFNEMYREFYGALNLAAL
jgi:predicted Zn finger-like uncharacterized protein